MGPNSGGSGLSTWRSSPQLCGLRSHMPPRAHPPEQQDRRKAVIVVVASRIKVLMNQIIGAIILTTSYSFVCTCCFCFGLQFTRTSGIVVDPNSTTWQVYRKICSNKLTCKFVQLRPGHVNISPQWFWYYTPHAYILLHQVHDARLRLFYHHMDASGNREDDHQCKPKSDPWQEVVPTDPSCVISAGIEFTTSWSSVTSREQESMQVEIVTQHCSVYIVILAKDQVALLNWGLLWIAHNVCFASCWCSPVQPDPAATRRTAV